MLCVSNVFLDSCSKFGCCSLDDGRVLYFWSDSAEGAFDYFLSYLDPQNPGNQINALQTIKSRIRANAHVIIEGDFNFVCDEHDRITNDFDVPVLSSARQAKFWTTNFSGFTEFDQPLFTCKYASGMSKIDRSYTSLKPLEFSEIGTACNLLEAPTGLSDHFPISKRFFDLARQVHDIPRWVSAEPLFHELVSSYLLDAGLGSAHLETPDLVSLISADNFSKVHDHINIAQSCIFW